LLVCPGTTFEGSNTRPATCYQEAARAAQLTRPPNSRQHQILNAIVVDRHLPGARHRPVGVLCAHGLNVSWAPTVRRLSSSIF